MEVYLDIIKDNCSFINLTYGRLSFHSKTLSWLLTHHPAYSGLSAWCHYVSLSSREKEETSLKWTRSFTFSLWVTWRSYLWELSLWCPLGTCRRSITTDGQCVWSFSPFPHIKLSLCQMSYHQIWCCQEIAIIFICFFLWPFDFIQSTENPSRWFREHVSSKSIGPTVPDSFLFSLRGEDHSCIRIRTFYA